MSSTSKFMSEKKPALIRVFRNVSRPTAELIAPFKNVPTGNVCDAMDRFGALDYQIKPLDPTSHLCGTAITIRTRPCDNLAIYQALELAQPGDVLVIQTYDYTAGSVIGDLVVNNAKRRGLAGIVTDGLVRDASGIRAIGLPVFARGLSPASPFKDGGAEINGAISCGGVAVHPGDLIVGDEDGVVVVPQVDLQAVAERLQGVFAKESKMLAAIESGQLTNPAMLDRLAEVGVEFVD
jgi:4-hydroxy-4-methyl-2-oxoglutarate aldolase